MRYHSNVCSWLLVSLSLLPLPASRVLAQHQADAVDTSKDSEQRLTDQSKAERAFTQQLNRIAKTAEDDPRRLRVYGELQAHFPQSEGTARLRVKQITPLGDQGKWAAYVEQSSQWLERYPQWSRYQHALLYDMARRLYQKDVPDDVKFSIFTVMLPHLSHRQWLGSYTRNYLARLDKTPLEQYQLAQRLANTTGPGNSMRAMLWGFINQLQTTHPDAAQEACKQLIEQYGQAGQDNQNHLETHLAQLFLLSQQAGDDPDARQAVKARQQAFKQTSADFKTNFATTFIALKQNDPDDAPQALAGLLAATPVYLHQTLWRQLVQKFGQLDQETRIAIIRAYAGKLPDSGTAEAMGKWVMRDLLTDEADFPTLLTIQQQCNDDAGRSLNMWRYTLKTLENLKASPTTLSRAYGMAADAATKLGAHDVAAEYLYESARTGWDTDLPHAIDQLKQAATTRHWLAAGAKAQWFLDYLQGRNKLVQPVSPRQYNPANHVNQTLPELSLPALASTASVMDAPVVQTDNHWTLAAQDMNENLVAHQQPVASDDQDHANAATDQDPQTTWQPDTFPAAMVVALTKQASVHRIEVELSTPTHLVFTLLNSQGKSLAKFERDWSFWDHHKGDSMWAQGKLTLNLPPVENVSYVRVDVFGSLGKPAINQLAIYPTAHRTAGWHVQEPVKLSANTNAITLHTKAQEPTLSISRDANSEAVRGYPIHRWRSPWTQKKGEIIPRQNGGNVACLFDGTNLTLTLQGTGGLDWQIDDGPIHRIDQTEPAKNEYPLAANLRPGRHILRLTNRALPARNDQWGSDNIHVTAVTTNAKATARAAVRFSEDGKNWTDWYTQPHDDSQSKTIAVALPESDGNVEFKFAQAGVWLDAAATQGQVVPVLQSLRMTQSATPNLPAGSVLKQSFETDLPQNTNLVASLLAQRSVVVVYPKIGSQETYELAKAIADKANVYLVSDDMALNDYPGFVLAIGTPLQNRYTRQLTASHGLWLDAHYLNHTTGTIAHTLDQNNQPKTLYLTGETPKAIHTAAKRLLTALDQAQANLASQQTQNAQTPITLFAASTLEMVYPWQLHTERPALKQLDLRMAINDRRNVQFGLATQKPLDQLSVSCSELTTSNGKKLPASQINLRVAGSYEWIPFFGDLRLPNILTPTPVLPMPANASIGIWLTAVTNASTQPGVYQGTLSISANEHTTRLPVSIVVEPIPLPATTKTATYSFANVPYWFTHGSETWQHAAAALAANEADHGANYVSILFDLHWQPAAHLLPHEYRMTANAQDRSVSNAHTTSNEAQTNAAEAPWRVMQNTVTVQPQQALEVRFSRPISPWAVGAAFKQDDVKQIKLQVLDEQSRWQDVSTLADADGLSAPVIFETRKAITASFTTYRLMFDAPSPVTVIKLTAFTDRKQTQLFTCDFSGMLKQMAISDKAYESRSLPLPGFIAQVSTEAHRISESLLGVSSSHDNVCTQTLSRQLLAALKAYGSADRFLLKVGDEPRDIVQWSDSARPYSEAGLRTMTCHGVHYPDMSVAIGLINPWVPNYQHNINLPFLRERQKLGEPLWWYECGVPVTRMTGSPIENLPFYWLTGKWRLDGAMNYAAMHTSDFSMPVPFRYEHGLDHRMVFQADGSVLDTTRRELESDGINDLKLIEFIRQRCATMSPDKASQIEAKLDALLEQIVPYKYGYSMEPADWEAARDALYDLARQSAGA